MVGNGGQFCVFFVKIWDKNVVVCLLMIGVAIALKKYSQCKGK